MRARAIAWLLIGVGVLGSWPARRAVGQEVALAARSPRFLYAPSGAAPVEIDASRAAVLRRVVSLQVEQPTVGRVLAEIERQTGLTFAYGNDFPTNRPVTLRADSITVVSALAAVLYDAGVDVVLSPGGHVALVKRGTPPPVGSIAGRMTDAKTQTALAGATVVVQGTPHSATSGNDGRYRIADVPAGTYTLRARYIGYAPATASVTVSADQEATADFGLEKSAQRLDEVVTTGTVVPTEVKALPVPVSVISDSEITRQHPRTLNQVLRQAVPTMVSWDEPDVPNNTPFSARGASTIGGGGGGQMKIFLDGIPMADMSLSAIDPVSIARIEVIRGPQAAAIYGSDAVGGVIQVFTKRGDAGRPQPQADGEAAAGVIQTPYAGYETLIRQSYRGAVRGGAPGLSYQFGAGYTRIPDWVEPVTKQSSASVYGGMHATHGILTADVTGRYLVDNVPSSFDPALTGTGFFFWAKPFYQPVQQVNQSIGIRLSVAPARWWQQAVTVGVDRLTIDGTQTQPRLTSVSDTLLSVSNSSETKASIGYNTTILGDLGPGATASLTVGFDHYSLPVSSWFAGSAVSASGDLGPASVSRTTTNNTGYFAQGQLAFRDALFLTAGGRAEQNSDFGDSLGTPVSPQFGLSYVRGAGPATIKIRGSWGRAIRPPQPQAKLGSVTAGAIQLASPRLGPERQHGWDTGIDAVFGTRGSLSITYYDQTAENLITNVLVAPDPVPTYQNQNVARVTNRGIELEGTLSAGPLQLKAQYGYVRSRVEDLGLTYSGDLAVGDEPLVIPAHTAGGAITAAPFHRTTVSTGLTYVGSYRSYDLVALFSCFAGTAPCGPGPGTRSYIVSYPSFVKLNATVSQQLTPTVSGFLAIDNLTDNRTHEFSFGPVMGRISTIGLRVTTQ
jgi:outer membrane receptor protein involved in Fe transport